MFLKENVERDATFSPLFLKSRLPGAVRFSYYSSQITLGESEREREREREEGRKSDYIYTRLSLVRLSLSNTHTLTLLLCLPVGDADGVTSSQ